MKNKALTAVSTIMMVIPWTIFILRMNQWALESPAAEIIIGSYIVFMLFSGIFTTLCYAKGKIRNKLIQICMIVNDIFAFFGICAGGWMLYSALV